MSAALMPWVIRALRVLAAVILLAMLLDVPLAPRRSVASWVAVDVSASWRSGGDDEAWRRARATVDSLAAAGADSLLLFGDSVRGGALPTTPVDGASNVEPLVDLARAAGRPLVIVTDGRLDGAAGLAELPRGSRVLVVAGNAVPDAGIAAFDAPTAAVAGDTIDLQVVIRASERGAAATTLRLLLGDRELRAVRLVAMEPSAERLERLRVVTPARDGAQQLRAVLAAGDAVPQNDTATRTIDVRAEPAAVLVSTSPDQDARFALDVLRGTRRGAIRGYWRVAPNVWRTADGARPVDEAVVRRSVAEAGLVVLHGDTAFFGPPRARTRGALVLMTGPSSGDESYAMSAGDSPLRAALGELPWDSLPPLVVSAAPVSGAPALLTRRARRTDERAAIVVQEGARRAVVVTASGFWRWRTRGGRPADAFDAVWGSIFDWVGAVRRAQNAGEVGGAPVVASEWVPRAPTVVPGPIGAGPAGDVARRAGGSWWLAALAIAALCVEWVLRRRIGWR